jgi:hypothetical protein
MAVQDISTITFGSNTYNLKDPTKAASTSVPASAAIDASTGVISFKNSSGTQLFTVTLPKYNGEVV